MDIRAEVALCQERERTERAAAVAATSAEARETHFMMAERYADRAWSLLESLD